MIYCIKNNLMKDFAEWLKTNRQREKVSLRRLADKIGNLCSDAFLSQIENRKYPGKKGKLMRPDREIVIALAKALHADENEALRLADYATEHNAADYPQTAEEFAEALKRYGVKEWKIAEKDLDKLGADFFRDVLESMEMLTRGKLQKLEEGEVLTPESLDKVA